MKRGASGMRFGGEVGFWRVARFFLGVDGRGEARGGREVVERECAGASELWRRSIAGGALHGDGAGQVAARGTRAADPCRGHRSILAGADIGLSGW